MFYGTFVALHQIARFHRSNVHAKNETEKSKIKLYIFSIILWFIDLQYKTYWMVAAATGKWSSKEGL